VATGDAASLGARIGPRLGEVLTDSPHVGDIRGIGMMSAVEFVRDREAPTSFRRSERITEKPWQALFDQGVILYKSIAMAGTDGLIVAPSLVITEDEIDLTVEKLGAAPRSFGLSGSPWHQTSPGVEARRLFI
jgi:adenosylmethionine-8-amino-7-oxononanoate aminotransferase